MIVVGATFLREDFKLKGQSLLHHIEGKKLASKIPLPELLNWVVKFLRPLNLTHIHRHKYTVTASLDKQQVCVPLLPQSGAEGSRETQKNNRGHFVLARLEYSERGKKLKWMLAAFPFSSKKLI